MGETANGSLKGGFFALCPKVCPPHLSVNRRLIRDSVRPHSDCVREILCGRTEILCGRTEIVCGRTEILCGTCGGMLVALIALISLNFRSVKVMQIAFFAKFYRFENWTVFTSPAGRRTSCACVRDGFCKRVFVTVFTSPESRRVHFLRVCS